MIKILILTQNGEISEVFCSREWAEVEIIDREEERDEEDLVRVEKTYPYRIY